jgi:hypothetical protein
MRHSEHANIVSFNNETVEANYNYISLLLYRVYNSVICDQGCGAGAAGAGLFCWSRSRSCHFAMAPAPEPAPV